MPIISDDYLDRMLALSSADNVLAAEKLDAEAERMKFEFELAAHPERVKILAEGDSWFAYPRQYFIFGAPANVIHHLRERDEFVIQNTSSNGDEAVAMLTGSSKIELLERLQKDHYDVLLFSGGGNDIVGAFDMDFFLKRKENGMKFEDCIVKDRFERRLRQVADAYHDLMDLVDIHSSNTNIKVVTHTYDYVVPGERGAIFLGGAFKYDKGRSWMYPYMMAKGITEAKDQREIAKYLLTEFKKMLQKVAKKYPQRLFVVDTQGTLNDTEEHWLNEIHPTPEGFKKIEEKIYKEIKEALKPKP